MSTRMPTLTSLCVSCNGLSFRRGNCGEPVLCLAQSRAGAIDVCVGRTWHRPQAESVVCRSSSLRQAYEGRISGENAISRNRLCVFSLNELEAHGSFFGAVLKVQHCKALSYVGLRHARACHVALNGGASWAEDESVAHSGVHDCSCATGDLHSSSHTHSHGHVHYSSPSTCHSHGSVPLNSLQEALSKLAQVLWVTKVADLLRDNLSACLVSFALLVLGALAPIVWPTSQGTTLQNALSIVAFPLTAVPAVLDATIGIAGGRVDIHILMALAAVSSVFLGNVWEGGLLLAMFSMSHIVEEYLTSRALGDLKALKERNPEVALVLTQFDVSSPPPLSSMAYGPLPVTRVVAGSYLLVKAGETVPVDGEVFLGRSMVTVEHLTGESHPQEKQKGDFVPGGARSLNGMIVLKATRTWKDSTMARIMQMTEEAQLSKPVLQKWLDQFGDRYSRVVIGLSMAVAVLGPLVFKWPLMNSPGTRGSIYRGLGLMVSASPCALAVAPLAYSSAISACANKGILLRGGEILDYVSACDTVAFDKTGTLTTGELLCKGIEPLYGHSNQGSNNGERNGCCSPSCDLEALAVAAAMESGATHPIARAVLEYGKGRELPVVIVDNFESFAGEGLAADVTLVKSGDLATHRAFLGSLEFICSSFGTDSIRLEDLLAASSYGSDLIRVALYFNKKVTLFHFEDKLRSSTASVVGSLKNLNGLRLMMLTGDHLASAERVGKAVGIDEIYSGMKPEDKLQKTRSLSGADGSRGLIMVGDGINDAPAIAAATVGVVLAKHASATAVAVADVLLLQDALDCVPFLIAKAHQTTELVKQSVMLALVCIVVASLPSVMGMLPLWLTVLLHEGGTLVVCLNSARAFRSPKQAGPSRVSAVSRILGCGAATLKGLQQMTGLNASVYHPGTAPS